MAESQEEERARLRLSQMVQFVRECRWHASGCVLFLYVHSRFYCVCYFQETLYVDKREWSLSLTAPDRRWCRLQRRAGALIIRIRRSPVIKRLGVPHGMLPRLYSI